MVELYWDDVVAMRERLLTYPQMADVLDKHYGISLSPKHLAAVVRTIERRRKGRFAKGVPGVARQTQLSMSAGSPLDEVRARSAEKRDKLQVFGEKKGD